MDLGGENGKAQSSQRKDSNASSKESTNPFPSTKVTNSDLQDDQNQPNLSKSNSKKVKKLR